VTIDAAILAGGRARRFGGADKSALLVGGRTIRERQLEALRAVTPDVRVIVEDPVPGCGPLGGLHTALSETAADATIVVACDMPYLSAPLLRHMCGLAAEADAVVPQTERGYHPLCAVYTRACLAPIARRLEAKRLKMTDLFDDVRVRVVTADELNAFGDPRRLLANVNSPADHRELEALQGHEL
jgi:molybdopterin-guanine dinucleotide biosynthesis protein A